MSDINTNSISREQLEAQFVTVIQQKLKNHQMTGNRAKEIAQIILTMIPEDITHAQLLQVIPQLDDQLGDLAEVVHSILTDHNERLKNEALPKIREMLSQIQNKK